MKKLLIIVLAVSALCVLLAGLSFADEAKKAEAKKPAIPAGQKVFTEAKCQMCHTVLSAGIGEAPAEDAEEEEEAEAGPPDLSVTGAGRTAEWLSLFMQKKETLNDKKHMQKFKGSDEDLTALADWLVTLKPAEKKAAPKAEKSAGAAAGKATGAAAEKAAGAAAGTAAEGEAAGKTEDSEDHDTHESHEDNDSGDHSDTDADTEAEKGE